MQNYSDRPCRRRRTLVRTYHAYPVTYYVSTPAGALFFSKVDLADVYILVWIMSSEIPDLLSSSYHTGGEKNPHQIPPISINGICQQHHISFLCDKDGSGSGHLQLGGCRNCPRPPPILNCIYPPPPVQL